MSDRELLELAAKAANIDIERINPVQRVNGPNPYIEPWNPLNDDGDALRLAVRLGMEVYIDTHPEGCACTEAQSHTHKRPDNAMRSIVNHGDDIYAATRRAIVVAAALIGEEMP